MVRSDLRIYYGPDDENPNPQIPSAQTPGRVAVPLSEIFPLLAEAMRSDRAWLRDFQDDEIISSEDLHQVLLAYRQYRQSTA